MIGKIDVLLAFSTFWHLISIALLGSTLVHKILLKALF
jgi:hypothetical protein